MRGDGVKMAKIHYIHVLNCQERLLQSLVCSFAHIRLRSELESFMGVDRYCEAPGSKTKGAEVLPAFACVVRRDRWDLYT